MSIRELKDKLAQGWTYIAATMGKGREKKYPNIAKWHGGYSSYSSDGLIKISLVAISGTRFHTTLYTLVEKEFSGTDENKARDEIKKHCIDEYGEDAILRFQRGWMGEENWESHYPHIAQWINQGKRHCIHININFVTGKSDAKAWLYDKPSDTETVLFEQELDSAVEQEVLQSLDEGIKNWLTRQEKA